jgi:hypothetical protein
MHFRAKNCIIQAFNKYTDNVLMLFFSFSAFSYTQKQIPQGIMKESYIRGEYISESYTP